MPWSARVPTREPGTFPDPVEPAGSPDEPIKEELGDAKRRELLHELMMQIHRLGLAYHYNHLDKESGYEVQREALKNRLWLLLK